MNCPHCGGELSVGAAFCRVCGTSISMGGTPEENQWDNQTGDDYPYWEGEEAGLLPDRPGEVVYEPPEGYAYDEQSGLYIQEAIAIDDIGNEILWTNWFDPVTGEYTQRSRILWASENTEPVGLDQGKRKRTISIAAVTTIVVIGVVAAQLMGWIDLPVLSKENTADPIEGSSIQDNNMGGRRETAPDTAILEDTPELSEDSTENTDAESSENAEEPSSMEMESSANASEVSMTAQEYMPDPAEESLGSWKQVGSGETVQISTGLSSSPCPIVTASARYRSAKAIAITYEISEDFQEYATLLLWYGIFDEDRESVEEAIEYAKSIELPEYSEDPDMATDLFGYETEECDVLLYAFDDPEQIEFVYLTLITFDEEFQYVAHTIMRIDLAKL